MSGLCEQMSLPGPMPDDKAPLPRRLLKVILSDAGLSPGQLALKLTELFPKSSASPMHKISLFSTLALATATLAAPVHATTYELVTASEVEWQHLNPARGDKSPGAGTLWGDRNGSQATGYLLRPTDGFQSPPHIHNVSYRGVVISGVIHNDDPDAARMWMPRGSFWTQPKGEVHITAAQGNNTLAYIEIDEGPYLVKPASEAFDNGERPVNVDATNLVWLNASDLKWNSTAAKDAGIALLWGTNQPGQLRGSLLKLPAGFQGELSSTGDELRAVIIQGQPDYRPANTQAQTRLSPGSYFGALGESRHSLITNSDTLIYLRSDAQVQIRTVK